MQMDPCQHAQASIRSDLRFPTAQGKCWHGVGFGVPVGTHSHHGQVALVGCYSAPLGTEKTIPLSLALGPRACHFLRSGSVSFQEPLSGKEGRLEKKTWCFFTFPWICPVKLSGSFAVNCNSSRHSVECDKIQQKSLKLPRLPPVLQLIFCPWLLYETRYISCNSRRLSALA